MTGAPEPRFWETSGFWAAIYLVVMLYAVVRETWGKDEAERRPVLRRVLIAGGAVWLVLHAWAAWSLLAGLHGLSILGPRRTPRDEAIVAHEALLLSVASMVLFASTVLSCALFARPPRRGWRLPWMGIGLTAAFVAAVWAIPMQGEFTPIRPPLRGFSRPEATWEGRAMVLGGLATLPAVLVLLASAISRLLGRWPEDDARKEVLKRDLALWGFVLFAGAVLLLERGALGLVSEVAILGPRGPGWGTALGFYFRGSHLPIALALLGLVALCFGTLHLRRRGEAEG